jgi:hypothetical protein
MSTKDLKEKIIQLVAEEARMGVTDLEQEVKNFCDGMFEECGVNVYRDWGGDPMPVYEIVVDCGVADRVFNSIWLPMDNDKNMFLRTMFRAVRSAEGRR